MSVFMSIVFGLIMLVVSIIIANDTGIKVQEIILLTVLPIAVSAIFIFLLLITVVVAEGKVLGYLIMLYFVLFVTGLKLSVFLLSTTHDTLVIVVAAATFFLFFLLVAGIMKLMEPLNSNYHNKEG